MRERGVYKLPWSVLLVFTLVAAAFPAYAAQPEDLGLSVRDKVREGKEKPAILLKPAVSVKSLVITLKSKATGTEQVLRTTQLRKGKSKALEFKQGSGTEEYDAHFSVTWTAGKVSEFGFTFSAQVVGEMRVSVNETGVDLDGRTLKFSSNREVQGAEVFVFGEGGRALGQGREAYGSASAGDTLAIGWSQGEAAVRKIELKVYDQAGFWKGVEIRPFFVEPREDQIFFETGSHTIARTETGKLNETYAWIRKGVEAAKNQAGVSLGMRLYVGGYTDTVGPADANRSLSMKRAKSIARYFRDQGLKIDIFYQGFGEDALAVTTPDNTASEKNRRTVYVLSSQVPPVSRIFPRTKWSRLP